jgi:hypothetical protein
MVQEILAQGGSGSFRYNTTLSEECVRAVAA